MTLYRHLPGRRVKSNIAAASCDSVRDNGVNPMYHCHRGDPIRVNHDVSRNNLAVVLLVHEGWGERSSANPLYNRSDRKSETLWSGREVPMRRVNQFCAAELEERGEPGFRPSTGGGALLRSPDVPLMPPTRVRCTPDLWPAILDRMMILQKSAESLHGRFWNYHSVFLRVRPGGTRWIHVHSASPAWDTMPARISLDTGYRISREKGNSGLEGVLSTPAAALSPEDSRWLISQGGGMALSKKTTLSVRPPKDTTEGLRIQRVNRRSASRTKDILSGRTATALPRLFPEMGHTSCDGLFQCQCFSDEVNFPRVDIPEGSVRIRSDQTPTTQEDFSAEWEFTDESPGGLPPRDEKVGMLSCRGHPLAGPCRLHDSPVRRCHMNSIVAILAKQNESVSPPRYHPFHLSPSPVDSAVEISLWSRRSIKPLRHSNRDWETEGLIQRIPWVPNLASIWSRPTTAYSTSTTSLCPGLQPSLSIEKFRPLPLENMHHASLCKLLLGIAITSSADLIHRSATLGSFSGLLSISAADRFTLRNGYGTVEARYHLTAYDCSDPSEVQAYSSILASHCSTRATPVRKDQPTWFELL